jgi:REP element-mobilizing transposase RayT
VPTDQVYRRHLPHQVPANTPIFLTWNLKGAVTREMYDSIEWERLRLAALSVREGEAQPERKIRENKLLFAYGDRLLGQATRGPMFLGEAPIAQIVIDSIMFGALDRYQLYAFVVMANHVHVLLTPILPLAKITQGIKGFTARQINQLQNQPGRIVWQDESYDHWVRDDEELLRIIQYIEQNPVVAGLCSRPEDWHASSARMRSNWRPGQPLVVSQAL